MCLWCSCPDKPVLASEQPRVSALRQLGYSHLAARTGDPVARPRGTIMAVQNPPGFLSPSDQVTAARVLATPRWELFPRAQNQVGKK